MKCYDTGNNMYDKNMSLNKLQEYLLPYKDYTINQMINMRLDNYVFFPMSRKEKWFTVIAFKNLGFKPLFLSVIEYNFFRRMLTQLS